MAEFFISELRVGKVRPLGPKGVPSGIRKTPVAGPVIATETGIDGDEQGDTRHHGGRDKAVHAYAAANYPLWAADLPAAATAFRPGAFGENLVVEGATEADIRLGDQWRAGDALLEVSQGRQPCWRLNLRFDRPEMARLVQTTGRSGWYFRVIEPGEIGPGATATLVRRPHPDWTIARVSNLLYHDRMNKPALAEFAALPGLPESWRRLAEARLANGRTEDWTRRIETPG
ncbi:MOSC domain-containing protein [Pikeienuella piscinae]|uniref:MOSC domain-containing protein n=1 Tax=Pikeienuella piscinae TaxID=2748098 RepID=A0A7L5BTH7_9RHOB|nr:MOSC domain-containing protein [Pikeienuella piscinae]QIE54722.1 MOSC domain-containing protein [Pikeienuella piscinae]